MISTDYAQKSPLTLNQWIKPQCCLQFSTCQRETKIYHHVALNVLYSPMNI